MRAEQSPKCPLDRPASVASRDTGDACHRPISDVPNPCLYSVDMGRPLVKHVACYREHCGPVCDDQIYRCMTETGITDDGRMHLEASEMFFAETVALVISDRPEPAPIAQ